MGRGIRSFVRENESKAAYDALKWAGSKWAYPLLAAIMTALWNYLQTASVFEQIFVAPSVLVVGAIGLFLYRYFFPDKSAPSVQFQIKSISADVWPHAMLSQEGFRNFDLELELQNTGEITADDISAEIAEMDTNPAGVKQDRFSFPAELPFPAWHNRSLNPHDSMKLLFMSEPRVVMGFSKPAVMGVIAGQAGFILITDTDYRVSIRISARNYAQKPENYLLRFTSERGGFAFSLRKAT